MKSFKDWIRKSLRKFSCEEQSSVAKITDPKPYKRIRIVDEVLIDVLLFLTRWKLTELQTTCYSFDRITQRYIHNLVHRINQLKIEDSVAQEPRVLILSNNVKNGPKYIPLEVHYEFMNTYITTPPSFIRFKEIHIDIESDARLPMYIKSFIAESKDSFQYASLLICNYSAIFISTKLFFGTAFDSCSEIHLDLRTALHRVLTHSNNKYYDGEDIPYPLWYDYNTNREKLVDWLYSREGIKKHVNILVRTIPHKLLDEIVQVYLF
jgi:hypothetical protein